MQWRQGDPGRCPNASLTAGTIVTCDKGKQWLLKTNKKFVTRFEVFTAVTVKFLVS
jgi:hypothetical protein